MRFLLTRIRRSTPNGAWLFFCLRFAQARIIHSTRGNSMIRWYRGHHPKSIKMQRTELPCGGRGVRGDSEPRLCNGVVRWRRRVGCRRSGSRWWAWGAWGILGVYRMWLAVRVWSAAALTRFGVTASAFYGAAPHKKLRLGSPKGLPSRSFFSEKTEAGA